MPSRKPNPQGRPTLLGSVRRDEVLPLEVLVRRMGWAEITIRQAKAAGLNCIPFGKRKYVLGEDVIAMFKRLREQGTP